MKNREIKFRAWDKKHHRMASHKVSLRVLFDETQDNFPVMQFTGLHDKNGKEIFEGDIVKTDIGICEIEWVGSSLALHTLPRETSRSIFSIQYHETEIIGNIYESGDR